MIRQPKKSANIALRQDAIDLFGGGKGAHMGRWCYGSLPHGDDRSGAQLWSALAEKKGGSVVLSNEEHLVLSFSLMRVARQLLGHARSVCELGPGSSLATERKVFPLLNLSEGLHSYTSVDFSEEFGSGAMERVSRRMGIEAAWRQSHVFEKGWNASLASCDLMLAFDMIGNMITGPGVAPDDSLIGFFHGVRSSLNSGGAFIASFNTEMNGQRVVESYLDQTNQDFCLGIVRRIARELPVSGMFDPSVWHYAPEWHEGAGQCAHMLYPVRDQNFRIGDRAFSIKAGRKFHLSNSYRYTPAQIRACAAAAGFAKVNVLQHGTAALLVAQNGLSVANAAPASSVLLQN